MDSRRILPCQPFGYASRLVAVHLTEPFVSELPHHEVVSPSGKHGGRRAYGVHPSVQVTGGRRQKRGDHLQFVVRGEPQDAASAFRNKQSAVRKRVQAAWRVKSGCYGVVFTAAGCDGQH